MNEEHRTLQLQQLMKQPSNEEETLDEITKIHMENDTKTIENLKKALRASEVCFNFLRNNCNKM